jgi:hypothetical protein
MDFWLGGVKVSCEIKSALGWSGSHGKSGVVNSSRMSSSHWNCREYRGSRGVTLVNSIVWLYSDGEELGG